ncbi:hypothetical protein [Psychrobacter sp. M13]|nr:hypothetical protein [Psychrobacter sp. M13]WLP93883.1 hypothetical protein Q9G97_09825 [Psychrobacter sp. M13]
MGNSMVGAGGFIATKATAASTCSPTTRLTASIINLTGGVLKSVKLIIP